MPQTIDELNPQFGLDGAVKFDQGRGGLTRAVIRAETAEGEIYLHGAHVANYQPRGQKAVLFLSPKSFFENGKAIRGGVPVIFPWFGPLNGDKSKMHGFVRLKEWELVGAQKTPDGGISLSLSTAGTAETRAIWPHDFLLGLTVTFGRKLEMALEVRNTSKTEFTFDEGLHTYFAVADVRGTLVRGLKGANYRDRNISEDTTLDREEAVAFPQRTDRMYNGTPAMCTIEDPGNSRRISVAKTNSQTTVVWNPGALTPADFADIDVNDWHKFVCVETCNARADAATLAPGATHIMAATIEAAS